MWYGMGETQGVVLCPFGLGRIYNSPRKGGFGSLGRYVVGALLRGLEQTEYLSRP